MTKKTRGHVLLVDDHIDAIDYVRLHLERNRYAVSTTTRGKSALRVAADMDVDIIFLDVHMPEMSGVETCRALRCSKKHANTPIIFMTADDSESSELAGLDAGADEYLVKPVSAAALEKRVAAYMRKTKQLRDIQKAAHNWRKEAFTDALTGTRSRRYAELMMHEKADGWVIMCDIDHFKSYNDAFGHEAGDGCLKSVAETLMRFGHDVVRMGGEEFLILTHNPDDITQILEKVESNVVKPDGQAVTVSVGAVFMDTDAELSDAVRHADMLLYQSKHSGRNTATFGAFSDGVPDIPGGSGRRCFRGGDALGKIAIRTRNAPSRDVCTERP